MKANKTRKLNATIKKVNTVSVLFQYSMLLNATPYFKQRGRKASYQRPSDQLLHIEILEVISAYLAATRRRLARNATSPSAAAVATLRIGYVGLHNTHTHVCTETRTQRMHATLR